MKRAYSIHEDPPLFGTSPSGKCRVWDDQGRPSRRYFQDDAYYLRDWLINRANGYKLSREAEARIHAAG